MSTVGTWVKINNPSIKSHGLTGLIVAENVGTFHVLFANGVKHNFKAGSLELLNNHKAKLVTYHYAQYLVTAKATIVSMQSHRMMRWPEGNPIREAILALAL